jgi:hypothetical protein
VSKLYIGMIKEINKIEVATFVLDWIWVKLKPVVIE